MTILLKQSFIFFAIVSLTAPDCVFGMSENKNCTWFSREGIWDVVFQDAYYCLYHSFAEELSAPKGPLALYHKRPVENLQAVSFKAAAKKFNNSLSFGISLRSSKGRQDIVLCGSNTVATLLLYQRLNNGTIISLDTMPLKSPVFIDSMQWHSISLVFGNKFVTISCDTVSIAVFPRASGFDKNSICGIATVSGTTWFRDIQITDEKNKFCVVLKNASISLPHLLSPKDGADEWGLNP